MPSKWRNSRVGAGSLPVPHHATISKLSSVALILQALCRPVATEISCILHCVSVATLPTFVGILPTPIGIIPTCVVTAPTDVGTLPTYVVICWCRCYTFFMSDQSTRSFVFGVRMTPSVYERLKARAAMERRSAATLALMLIEDGLDHGETPRAAIGQRASPPPPVLPKPAAGPGKLGPPLEPRPVGRVVQPRSTRLPRGADTSVRVGAVVAAIGVEYRAEQNRPLGKNLVYLGHLIESDFSDVTDLSSARAKGAAAWIKAGARPGLIGVLFPGDRGALEAAKQAQNKVQMDRRIDAGSDDRRFVAEKGIYGMGAVVLRRILAEHFPDLTIEEAVAKGSDAWLAAEVSEDTARRLFGDKVGDEAKRRATARANQRKQQAKAQARRVGAAA
jgi:hypothetical protein